MFFSITLTVFQFHQHIEIKKKNRFVLFRLEINHSSSEETLETIRSKQIPYISNGIHGSFSIFAGICFQSWFIILWSVTCLGFSLCLHLSVPCHLGLVRNSSFCSDHTNVMDTFIQFTKRTKLSWLAKTIEKKKKEKTDFWLYFEMCFRSF